MSANSIRCKHSLRANREPLIMAFQKLAHGFVHRKYLFKETATCEVDKFSTSCLFVCLPRMNLVDVQHAFELPNDFQLRLDFHLKKRKFSTSFVLAKIRHDSNLHIIRSKKGCCAKYNIYVRISRALSANFSTKI